MTPKAGVAAAELRDVRRSYPMGHHVVHALRGVSLSVEPGELVAVMGPSGSGKSTLLHLLGCLDQPDAGEVRIAGVSTHDLDDVQLSAVRNRSIGFVFQSFHLIPRLSVAENVAVPLLYRGLSRREEIERSRSAVHAVGLSHRIGHLPSELSGGERQRTAIARALVTDPDLLLADEPTGNLDAATGREVMEILLGLNREGRTLVVVTHNPGVAAYARRVISIEDGRIAAAH